MLAFDRVNLKGNSFELFNVSKQAPLFPAATLSSRRAGIAMMLDGAANTPQKQMGMTARSFNTVNAGSV